MSHDALARIQSSLRAAASRHRETARPGPFLVTITRESDNPFLNYAIPDDGAEPTPEDAAALAAAFEAFGRKARLEYIPELAPRVEPTLLAAGFAVEMRTPLMLCPSLRLLDPPCGIEFVEPRDDREVRDLLSSLNEAYGGGPPSDEDMARQRSRLEEGMVALLARDAETGEPAGGGLVVPPEGGVAEVAGIGVRPAFRRRGIAAALVSQLTHLALARGTTLPFLMAATQDEARIYARAGYETVGEVLHLSK